MPVARAEIVDELPAKRNVALLRHDGNVTLLIRRGEVSSEALPELVNALQLILDDGEGGTWPPQPPTA